VIRSAPCRPRHYLPRPLQEVILKNGIWLKVEEEVKRQPEEYMKYFEDWLFASDKEIESYNFFRMASKE
jgi:hypothetical protein